MKKLTLLLGFLMITGVGMSYACGKDKACCKKGEKTAKCCKDKKHCDKDAKETKTTDTKKS